jgi:hypothetical protein
VPPEVLPTELNTVPSWNCALLAVKTCWRHYSIRLIVRHGIAREANITSRMRGSIFCRFCTYK